MKFAKYLKSIVYGGVDGTVTTFAIVAGVAGAALSPGVTLVLGFANLFADGLSMGVGDYLSTKAELAVKKKQTFDLQKAKRQARNNGVVTFLSFVLFGFVPLVAYVVAKLFGLTFNTFLLSCILTGITFFVLGCVKAYFADLHWFRAGLETLLLGGAAAGVSFWIGHVLSGMI